MNRWTRLPWAVLFGAALARACLGQIPAEPGADGAVVAQPVETWLDPQWVEADAPCAEQACAERPGVLGWMAHRLPHYSARHIGLGAPLMGTSWLNRPMYVGGFLGESFGSTLVSDELDMRSSLLGGGFLGYDLNHYWGGEIRLGLSSADVQYVPSGAEFGESHNAWFDLNLMYYPWGDSRWRPFATVGVGIGSYDCAGDYGVALDHTGLGLPLGLGVKYLCGKQLALRLDVRDNLVFGGHGADTRHSWAVTGGFEFRWGWRSAAEYSPW